MRCRAHCILNNTFGQIVYHHMNISNMHYLKLQQYTTSFFVEYSCRWKGSDTPAFMKYPPVLFPTQSLSTHHGLVMPNGNKELGQHWGRYWLVAWWHQAITWTNVDLSSVRYSTLISGQFYNEYLSLHSLRSAQKLFIWNLISIIQGPMNFQHTKYLMSVFPYLNRLSRIVLITPIQLSITIFFIVFNHIHAIIKQNQKG